MSAYGQRLVVMAVIAVLDVLNYIFGIEFMGIRNEQVIGIILTLLLAIGGMVPGLGFARIALPTRPHTSP